MSPLDLFVLALVAVGAAGGWYLAARRRWQLLGSIGGIVGLGFVWAVWQMVATDDWDAYLFFAIAFLLAGPIVFGLLIGALGQALFRWCQGRQKG